MMYYGAQNTRGWEFTTPSIRKTDEMLRIFGLRICNYKPIPMGNPYDNVRYIISMKNDDCYRMYVKDTHNVRYNEMKRLAETV